MLLADHHLPEGLDYGRMAKVMIERLDEYANSLEESADWEDNASSTCIVSLTAARQAIIILDVSPC